MPLNGVVNVVTNPTDFFGPIALGGGAPGTSGYSPAEGNPGLTATLWVSSPIFEFLGIFLPIAAPVSTHNGSFSVSIEGLEPLGINLGYLTVNMNGFQFYRSGLFNPTEVRDLNLWLYQPQLPASAGVTAGLVSGALQGHGLPGNTQLTMTTWGLTVSGSKSEADVQFGVLLTPDTSPNLGLFLDLALNGWNISVGWPEDWCESADDILNSVRSGLQSADSGVNTTVRTEIINALQGAPLNLPQSWADNLFNNTSFQFVSLNFADNFSWPMSNTSDSRVVITPSIAIGWPRAF